MSDIYATLACALFLSWVLATLVRLIPGASTAVLRALLPVSLIALLLPLSLLPDVSLPLSAASSLRVLTGDLSPTGVLLITILLMQLLKLEVIPVSRRQLSWFGLPVIISGLLLYPTALGWSWLDPYSHGYFPLTVLLATSWLFVFALLAEAWLLSLSLTLALLCYQFQLLDSDNLWDYLMDPVTFSISLVLVIRYGADALRLPWTDSHSQWLLSGWVLVTLGLAVWVAWLDPVYFAEVFTLEDGLVEWLTVLGLLCCGGLLLNHAIRQTRQRWLTLGLALLCLFGAGEEISWGQRLLELETPAFFSEHNAQEEIGLHNLVVEWQGEQYKINRLVFGRGLAVGLLIYLFILIPVYHRNLRIQYWADQLGIPIARGYQAGLYLLVVATVELAIDSSKRGEMTELAGVLVFSLNVLFPENQRQLETAIDFPVDDQ